MSEFMFTTMTDWQYQTIAPKFSGFLITCTGADRRRVGDDPVLARRLRLALQASREYQRLSHRRKVQTMRGAMLLTHPSEDSK